MNTAKTLLAALAIAIMLEGLIYLLFAERIKDALELLQELDPPTIRFLASTVILIGFVILMMTFKVCYPEAG